jgi:hypothetical protein
MIIQEYFNRIRTLSTEENIQFSYDKDLENIVLKILQSTNEIYFTTEDFLDRSAPEAVVINTQMVKLFSDRLGLIFLIEKEAGNVCFANTDELRPEFRQGFTAIDILDYIYAFVHSSFYKEFQKIAVASEGNIFWELVKIGTSLRNKKE